MQNKIGKWNIASRIELLLAKIAGHDVDLGTMTPPVATNLTEELLLEIADRLDNSGGEGGGLLFIGDPNFKVSNLGVYKFRNIRTIDQHVSAQELYDAVLAGGAEYCWDGYTFCSEGLVKYKSAFEEYIDDEYGKDWNPTTDSLDFRSLGVVRNRAYVPSSSKDILCVTIEFVIAKLVLKGETSYLPLYYVAKSELLNDGNIK